MAAYIVKLPQLGIRIKAILIPNCLELMKIRAAKRFLLVLTLSVYIYLNEQFVISSNKYFLKLQITLFFKKARTASSLLLTYF